MARSIIAIALLAAALPLAAQASTASQQAAAVNHEPLQMASQTTTESSVRHADAAGYSDAGMSVAMADSQRAVDADTHDANQADDERSWLEILSDNNRDLGAPAGW
ncbi:hypothetical protein [Chromohalobacter canadensis]|uniref:Uncharacterized protein n=1 Tax=Chromohalobacter canadensis TaxID=141389 RepID=A0A285VCA3_9GAMM|nr:hypothetical protein [Chromohalobacter canadensis]MCK0769990.1 hypothetical protein [Chromohalobacter canadensis]WQH10498.1 hypothetical protein SR908_07440 [Chromohalobacter canadensis]SOC51690.1 hypothetical protein SAMN05421509_101385 [Chromohalobacter canadensis]